MSDPCSDPDPKNHDSFLPEADACERCLKMAIKFVEAFYTYDYLSKEGIQLSCYIGSIGFPIETYNEDKIVKKIYKQGLEFISLCGHDPKGSSLHFHMDFQQKDDIVKVYVTITK